MSVELTFLGVGDAAQQGLGHAAIAIAHRDLTLMVDCGPGTLERFQQRYQRLPDALFITHCHLDHIADMEKLFIKSWFSASAQTPLLFVPAAIVPLLHERVGNYPGALAEGGVNFWQAFQLIPVSRSFEFMQLRFEVWPARHHAADTAYSLYLPDRFYYTGDTRPVPEIIEHQISENATVFHDCSVIGNPSHSGIDDLLREYSDAVRARIYVYHYNNAQQRQAFIDAGLKCVDTDAQFTFA